MVCLSLEYFEGWSGQTRSESKKDVNDAPDPLPPSACLTPYPDQYTQSYSPETTPRVFFSLGNDRKKYTLACVNVLLGYSATGSKEKLP